MNEIKTNHKKICIALPIFIGLITPSLVLFAVQVFVGNIAPYSAVIDILKMQFASGHNLFLLALFGLIPFFTLSTILNHHFRNLNSNIKKVYTLCISGLIGILSLMIPGHVSVWYPLYGPGRMSSTAVIAFMFIPIYCLGTMAIGLLFGYLISKIFIKSS